MTRNLYVAKKPRDVECFCLMLNNSSIAMYVNHYLHLLHLEFRVDPLEYSGVSLSPVS